MDLKPFSQNGLELVINTETGEAFASQRAVARMVDRNESTIRTFIGARKFCLNDVEIQTQGGLQAARLLSEDQIYEAFAKYKPELLIQCAKAGIRVYLHTLAGYQVRSTAVQSEKVVQPQLPVYSAVEYAKTSKYIDGVNNLSLQELLRDQLIDELSVLQGKKQLLGQTEKKEYTIAKVRARELGYTTKEIGNGSGLGRYIAKNVPMAFAERVGKFEVKHYEICDRLDTQIHAYFGMRKSLTAK